MPGASSPWATFVEQEGAHQRAQPRLKAEEIEVTVALPLPITEARIVLTVEIVEQDNVAISQSAHLGMIDDSEAMDIAEQLHFGRPVMTGDQLSIPDPMARLALPPTLIPHAIPCGVEAQGGIVVALRFRRSVAI